MREPAFDTETSYLVCTVNDHSFPSYLDQNL